MNLCAEYVENCTIPIHIQTGRHIFVQGIPHFYYINVRCHCMCRRQHNTHTLAVWITFLLLAYIVAV